MTHEQETIDLPSASGMHRLANCPGSRRLIASLRERRMLSGNNSKDATIGERIHASLEGYPEELNLDEQDIKDDCARLAVKAATQFFGRAPTGLDRILYEQRFWYHIGETPFFSGKPDRVYVNSERILDVNYKTGRGDTEDAHLNLQLRTEVVLLKHCYPEVGEIGAVIVQPLVTNTPEIAIYDAEACHKALIEILEIVDATNWTETREAGPWCRYCPARAFCPEAYQLAVHYPATINADALPVGEEGAAVLGKLEIAKKVIDALWAAYRQLAALNPDAIPGWQISEGNKVRVLTDWKKLINKFDGPDDQAIIESMLSLPIGRVENWLADKWSLKGKAFTKRFQEFTEDCITIKKTAGSFQRIPKRLRE